MSSILRTALLVGAALLVALPAAAELFAVRLVNGQTFETRYQPRPAPWDAEKIVFLSDMGNWVALPRAEVASIEGLRDLRGFGRIIDTTTIELGLAPNDFDAEAAARMEAVPGPQRFDMEQFVEPDEVGGGMPVWGLGGGGSRDQQIPGAPLLPPLPPTAPIVPQAPPE